MVRKKTHEEFVAEVKVLVGDEYEVIGEYKNNHSKIEMKHSKCNYTYEVRPGSFLRGSRCPSCFGNTKKDTETFKKEVFELEGDEYEVIGKYKNSYTKLKMKHTKCNHTYEVNPNSFLIGDRCPSCSGNTKKDTETFKKEVFELVGDEFEVVGEYKDAKTKLKMKHTKCNHTYEVNPNNFLRGSRCPKCRESKGEVSVSTILEKLHVNHIAQAKFGSCKYRRPLPFDFAVYSASNELLGLIEYDGEQHFRAVDAFGGEKALKSTQRRDAIKTQYCADNGIPLLRIPYTEFDNIEAIVTNWITSLGKALQAA